MGSQAIVRFSKQANTSLVKYYKYRTAEKYKMIQKMLETAQLEAKSKEKKETLF